MSTTEFELEVQRRETLGKNHNRRLRQRGLVPAVVYGGDADPLPIQVDRKTVYELIKVSGGENAVFLLKLGGTDQSRYTMIRDVAIDPLRRDILHIDFQRVNIEEKVRVQVAVEAVGEPLGVRNEGGILDFVTREVEVECLPMAIPKRLEIDVSGLHLHQHLEARDLDMPEGVELLEEPDRVLLSVSLPRMEAIEPEVEEEELLEAEAEEPEVIGREREEEEQDEDAEREEG